MTTLSIGKIIGPEQEKQIKKAAEKRASIKRRRRKKKESSRRREKGPHGRLSLNDYAELLSHDLGAGR